MGPILENVIRKHRSGWWFTWVLLAAVLSLAACAGTPKDELNQQPATAVRGALSAPVQQVTPPLVSAQPSLPPVATVPPTAVRPTAATMAVSTTAPAAPMKFCCLRFATAVDAPPQDEYPAGTAEIFALWDYTDMLPGDRIRRIWFRDDLIWLTREEPWAWDRYGSAGAVTDIAVYDNEGDGLLPARYRLQLYVNDELQQEGRFVIAAP